MIRQIFSMMWKDLKVVAKDKTRMIGLFLMPLVLIIVMSLALQSLFDDDLNSKSKELPVVDLDPGFYSDQIITALKEMKGIKVLTEADGEPLTLEKAKQLIKEQTFSAVLVFPEDFSSGITDPKKETKTEFTLLTDAAVSIQYIAPLEGMLSSVSREVVYRMHSGEKNAPLIELNTEEITGGDTYIEVDTYQQNVPGYAILGVFLIVGTMAASVMQEKQEGTFRRLQAAPVTRAVLLAGKILPFYIINLLQIILMFGAAHLVFGMALGNIKALIVLSLALSAASTGLGMMLSALAKADTQIGGIASLLTLTMSALGGCFMPVAIMPDFLKTISRFIPHSWAMQGFQNVLVRGYGIADIFPQIAVLCGFTFVFFVIGVWRFEFE